MRRNIIAIGGGDIGVGQTRPFDEELVRLTGKPNPRLLFIPTATEDRLDYAETVSRVYRELGCQVDVLWLYGEDANFLTPREKILSADVVYVGGGNTKAMLARWKEFGVDLLLRQHVEAGKPAGGISAGAICWCRVGNSDWPVFEGIPGVNTARLDAMGLLDLILCPHASTEHFRLGEFREMMKTETGFGIALDDGCALQVKGDEYRILASLEGAVAHRITWRGQILEERTLAPTLSFQPIETLTF